MDKIKSKKNYSLIQFGETTMYYHAWARILGGSQSWKNLDYSDLIRNVLVPFVNRQLYPVGYTWSQALMNFGMVTYLRIFRTPDPIPNKHDPNTDLESERFAKFECTDEIYKTAGLENAWSEARPVLEAQLAPKIHRVFVVMQFKEDNCLKGVYDNVIKPVISEFGYEALRIDKVENSENVTEQILQALTQSEIVLCELTGERPNCYYETGYAHAMGRELILTIRRGETKHFNLASHNFIEWEDPEELRSGLKRRLKAIQQRSTMRHQDPKSKL